MAARPASIVARRIFLVATEESGDRLGASLMKVLRQRLGDAVRSHWGIENGLHWVMDMVFRDDECRIRKQNAPANFATVKHMASNLLRQAPGKDSLRVKRVRPLGEDELRRRMSRRR